MKVFVWRSNSEIDVYAFETLEQKNELKKQLVECLIMEGSQVNSDSSWSDIFEAIEDQRYSDSDMFEYGTGVETLKDLN